MEKKYNHTTNKSMHKLHKVNTCVWFFSLLIRGWYITIFVKSLPAKNEAFGWCSISVFPGSFDIGSHLPKLPVCKVGKFYHDVNKCEAIAELSRHLSFMPAALSILKASYRWLLHTRSLVPMLSKISCWIQTLLRVFPKIGVPQKWMVYDGKPY